MIRTTINQLYKTIRESQEEIEELRKQCKHRKTKRELYSWAPGHNYMADICINCDAVINDPECELKIKQT